MSGNRKSFLGKLVTLSVAGIAAGVPCEVEGLARASAGAETAQASNDAARAFAREMRRFDPSLTDAQLSEIAKTIAGAWRAGRRLHAGLTNADAPSPWFETGE